MRIAAGLSVLVLLASTAKAAAPPLQPHEQVVPTRDGCSVVIADTLPMTEATRHRYRTFWWDGACIDGLAMGEGTIRIGFSYSDGAKSMPETGWFWYGRPFGKQDHRRSDGAGNVSFTWEGRRVSYTTLDPAKVSFRDAERWGSNVSDGDTTVYTVEGQNGAERKISVHDLISNETKDFQCSPQHCDAVWSEHAGPVIERIKAFLAINEPKAEALKLELKPMVAAWKAKVGAKEVSRRKSDALQRNRKITENLDACFVGLRKADDEYYGSANKASDAFRTYRHGAALQILVAGVCRDYSGFESLSKQSDRLLAEAAPKMAALARVPELLQRANQLFDSGRYEEALTTYNEVRQADNISTAAHIGYGLSALRLQNFLGAKWAAEEVLKYDPNNPAAHDLLRAVENGEREREIAYQRQVDARRQENQALWNFARNTISAGLEARAAADAQAQAQAQAAQQVQNQALAARSQQNLQQPVHQPSPQQPPAQQSAASGPTSRLDGVPAHDCVVFESGSGGQFNGFRNKCGYAVDISWCNHPAFPGSNPPYLCSQNSFASMDAAAYGVSKGHVSPKVSFFACKAPDSPYQMQYDPAAQRIRGYCFNWARK